MAYRREIAIVLLMAVLLVGVWLLIGRLGTSSDNAQTQFVTDAVHNAALTCYAVEGTYPESLEYLREHYKLAYNTERFVVEYDAFASNLMPSITVLERGAKDV